MGKKLISRRALLGTGLAVAAGTFLASQDPKPRIRIVESFDKKSPIKLDAPNTAIYKSDSFDPANVRPGAEGTAVAVSAEAGRHGGITQCRFVGVEPGESRAVRATLNFTVDGPSGNEKPGGYFGVVLWNSKTQEEVRVRVRVDADGAGFEAFPYFEGLKDKPEVVQDRKPWLAADILNAQNPVDVWFVTRKDVLRVQIADPNGKRITAKIPLPKGFEIVGTEAYARSDSPRADLGVLTEATAVLSGGAANDLKWTMDGNAAPKPEFTNAFSGQTQSLEVGR